MAWRLLLVNGAGGISDIEGKAARGAASELGNERVSMEPRGGARLRWASRQAEMSGNEQSQKFSGFEVKRLLLIWRLIFGL